MTKKTSTKKKPTPASKPAAAAPPLPHSYTLFRFSTARLGDTFVTAAEFQLTTAQNAEVAAQLLKAKIDEFQASLPEHVRGQVMFEVALNGTLVGIQFVVPSAIWDAADDVQRAMMGSHVKLSLSATLRAMALALEAQDLFTIGKAAAGPFIQVTSSITVRKRRGPKKAAPKKAQAKKKAPARATAKRKA